MANPEIEETQPNRNPAGAPETGRPEQGATVFSTPEPAVSAGAPPQPPAPVTPKKKRRSRWPLFSLAGLFILLLIAAGSAYAGYNSGIGMRQQAEASQRMGTIQEQYILGVQEMESGQYYRARQRFEYVIQMEPNFPGVTEKLAAVLMELNTTATPTIAPTPTLTPTPDMRDVEEKYSQGQQFLLDKNWNAAIETLLSLRQSDPAYHMLEIDGMLFLALRNRGIDKMLQHSDLEGGIYDLTLASKFGPLDTQAQSYLTWASMYITGASFWGLDWKQAVFYFEQVGPAMPGLVDGSGMTAAQRYREALAKYGDLLLSEEQYCEALAQYDVLISLGVDVGGQETYLEAYENCGGDERDGEEGEGDGGEGQPTNGSPEGGEPSPEATPAE